MTIRDMVARRSDPKEVDDFIPTPPWATRVLYEYVAPSLKEAAPELSFYDPAAGQGHMLQVAKEYGHPIIFGTDINPLPEKGVEYHDYVWPKTGEDGAIIRNPEADAVVTNPPYKHLNTFMREGLDTARYHFALLVRVQSLESESRFFDIFSKVPPTQIAFFSARIPFKSGVVAKKAPKMFFHTWLHWDMARIRAGFHEPKPPMWIPPNAQQLLEKDADYE